MPVQVRDSILAEHEKVTLASEDVNRGVQLEAFERSLADGTASLPYGKAAASALLQRMARRTPYYQRNKAHLCSFFARGECNRGSSCPYRYVSIPNPHMLSIIPHFPLLLFLFTVTIFRLTRKLTLSPPACSRCALCMCFLADTKCLSGANWPTKISKTVFMDPMIRLPPRSCAVSPIRMTVRHHPCFVCTPRMCTPRFSARRGTGLSP